MSMPAIVLYGRAWCCTVNNNDSYRDRGAHADAMCSQKGSTAAATYDATVVSHLALNNLKGPIDGCFKGTKQGTE